MIETLFKIHTYTEEWFWDVNVRYMDINHCAMNFFGEIFVIDQVEMLLKKHGSHYGVEEKMALANGI